MWLRWEPLSLKFSCVLLLLSQPQEPWSTLSISGGRSGALRVILIIVRLISSADHLTCPSWVHLKTKVIAGHDGTHLLSRHLVAESGTSLSLRPAQCAKWVLRQPELLYRKTYLGGKNVFWSFHWCLSFPLSPDVLVVFDLRIRHSFSPVSFVGWNQENLFLSISFSLKPA